jgi:hypothetical protein
MSAISDIITNENGPEFEAAGLKFRFVNSDFHLHKTTDDTIVVLKEPRFLRLYDRLFESSPKRNVLEFGVFEGGSIILFALAYPDFRFVGVDIRSPNEAVLRHIRRLNLEDRVKIYYNTSQTDGEAIGRIIEKEFGESGIGIISDDASHNYQFSKRTFELTFGRLAPSGYYCLEDWAWAHWGEPYQTQQWVDQPALTNLLFEILILYASTHDLIANVETKPALACIRRGGAKIGELQIDKLLRMRGKKLTLI